MTAAMAILDDIARFIYPTYPPYLANDTLLVDAPVHTSLGALPLPTLVPNFIQMAIPGFLVSIALEIIISWIKHSRRSSSLSSSLTIKEPTIAANGSHTLVTSYYRVNDTINSISLGSLNQLFGLIASKWIAIVPYTYVWYHWRLMDWAESWTNWWIMFLLVDFGYYWFHRMSHEGNWAWAAHSVHHSSEEYNLSTALRQGTFQPLATWIFYIPVAWLGFSPRLFVIHTHFNTIYQFWIHTKLVPKLGWLEYIINTPSQHRVHHGRNPYCIDKNYAGTLCIWDRMFGTFAEEKDGTGTAAARASEIEEVKYGLVHAPPSWEPVFANWEHWQTMRKRNLKVKGILAKLPMLWRGPAYNPGGKDYIAPDVKNQPAVRYNPPISNALKVYCSIHWLLDTLSIVVFLAESSRYTSLSWTISLLGHIWTCAVIGLIMSHDSFAWNHELLRLIFNALASLSWWMDDTTMNDDSITSTVIGSLRDWLQCWPLFIRQYGIMIIVTISMVYSFAYGRREQRRFADGVRAAQLTRAKAKAEKTK